MKRKHIVTLVSSSTLASGMAHGAILYSGPVNSAYPVPASFPATGDSFDMNGDGVYDFNLGWDGYQTPNSQKPYIVGYPNSIPGSTVLARFGSFNNNGNAQTSYGLPITPFGSLIDSNYLAATPPGSYAYFNQDGNGNYTGDWQNSTLTEAYVGVELWDGTGNTNYGWVRIIYDGTISPKTLTLVDYAYETNYFKGIVAGSTNEIGAPNIYSEPLSQTNGVGANIQFSVTALASPAPIYHWQVGPTTGAGPYANLADGGTISGSSTAILTINGATATNQADYRVVISNSLGAATSSPPAKLTLISPVVSPPAPVLFAGLTANFNVTITGGLTPTFQWQQNGTNLANGGRISGATTRNLQISNLQGTDAGSYDVVVNFGSSPAPSAVSVLKVLPVSQENLYDAAVLADTPVVYYRLNDIGNPSSNNVVAYDNAGGFNGIYGIDVTNGSAGVQGPGPTNGYPGFAANNPAAFFSPADTNSWITLPPWNLNTNSVTFTAWVNPAATEPGLAGIVMTGTTNNTYAGLDYYYQADNNGNVNLAYQWNEGAGNDEDVFYQSALPTPTGEWSFVAVAVTPTNATLYVFNAQGTNSAVDSSANAGIFDPNGSTNLVMPFNNPEYIGSDPNGGSFGSQNFNGTISDVAVFNQTMSSDQLTTLYNAALGVLPPLNLQIGLVGTNVQITWPIGNLLQATKVNGPWTTNTLATSPYTVAPAGSMFYRVVVP
ncbi:MAG TPA: immunoglobulin domain-containing protein [Candidatus Saccharimonadales bacterium]|nr:immunoglobulin domain-containing protein [Candidatus Saccharimonadales bacterium]